jgi:hypothetical protein
MPPYQTITERPIQPCGVLSAGVSKKNAPRRLICTMKKRFGIAAVLLQAGTLVA